MGPFSNLRKFAKRGGGGLRMNWRVRLTYPLSMRKKDIRGFVKNP